LHVVIECSMKKILITAKNGQIGWELQRTLAALGDIVAVDRQTMDLSNPDSIRKTIREVKPNIIVNTAAYTAVDNAESEPELAMAINGVAPGILAEEAKRLNAAIIDYSTDYVFDGKKTKPYDEQDAPCPLNVYGKTKLAGEQAIQAVGVPHLIFRTSWVYGLRGRNFLLTILRLAKEKEELRVVNDQVGAPTSSRMVAEATALILARFGSPSPPNQPELSECTGLYHLTAAGHTTWYGFAEAILDYHRQANEAGDNAVSRLAKLLPVSTSGYPTPATRPLNSLLANDKLERTFRLRLPDWRHQLELMLDV